MTRVHIVSASLLAALVAGGALGAAAQDTPAAAPPAAKTEAPAPATAPAAAMPARPDPALDALRWFLGTWRCKGQASAIPTSPAHPTAADVHVATELGGFWIGIHYAERKTAANPHPNAGIVHWGYDGETKKLVAGSVGNVGAYAIQASTGWQGDTLVWEGPFHTGGATIQGRDTFVRKGRAVVHTAELQIDGNWQKVDEETCTRNAGKK